MRDRLLEGRAAQGLIAGLAPILDRLLGEAGLGEMVRENFRLGGRAIRELVAQRFGGAAVKRLTAAFEQVFVSRVLDQCVLEAVFGVWRQALDQQDVGLGEFFERGLEAGLVETSVAGLAEA